MHVKIMRKVSILILILINQTKNYTLLILIMMIKKLMSKVRNILILRINKSKISNKTILLQIILHNIILKALKKMKLKIKSTKIIKYVFVKIKTVRRAKKIINV
jgi:CRISPR/Cas system-associated exonuclease Cas4 (RecB family)